MEMKLTTKEQMAVTYLSTNKNTFKGARYINGIYMVEFDKNKIKYNRPIYVGTSIQDLSKLTMMKFHYDAIHNSLKGKYNMIYSDTDSLVYNIQHDNMYQLIRENKSQVYLSDSIRDDLTDNEHTHVIGKFKD